MCDECKAKLARYEADSSLVTSMWEYALLLGCAGADNEGEQDHETAV